MHLPDNQFTRIVTRKSVLIGVGIVVAALIIVDVFLATDDVSRNTWSELIRVAGKKTIAVPWMLGLVMGHWFHPTDHAKPSIDAPGNAVVLLAATLFVALVGLAVEIPLWIPLVLAAPVGALIWPVSTNPDAVAQVRKAVS